MQRRRFRCCLQRDFGLENSELCLKSCVLNVSPETESVLFRVAKSGHFRFFTDWAHFANHKLTRCYIAA